VGSTGGACAISGPNVDCTVNGITLAGTTLTATISPDPTLLGTTFAFKTVTTGATIVSASSIDAGIPVSAATVTTDVQRRPALNLTASTLLPNPVAQTGNIIF